ncbi:MAG: histidine kinase [Candidatus Binatus sp.]|uniref:sensor histidine kinase n=1 Tax=Candidatus Binatus sp. TaxID=2811406 RepID=UPI0027284310|nr:ATP-binding protein [Candidatus Binatus sp.]MDO8434305.1 histidine kinase [Candidatus Binatus sp.]
MADSTTSRDIGRQADAPTHSPAGSIAAIAALGSRAVGAERCALAWSAAGRSQVIWLPDRDSRWDGAIVTILAALDNRVSDAQAAERDLGREPAPSAPAAISLSARELAALSAGIKPFQAGVQFAASALRDGNNSVRIVLVAPHDRSRKELDAMLELMNAAALAQIENAAGSATLDFWRAHASKSAAAAHEAENTLQREREQSRRLDSAVASANQLSPHERFAGIGALVADFAGYGQWLLAMLQDGALKIAAASSPIDVLDSANSAGALSRCWRTREVVQSNDDPIPGQCIGIPFETGALALASDRGEVGARERAETMIARLAPILKCWTLEDESSRRRALVDRLALRMYAAVDEERARIARDLHDDQAQLLTAAKIALTGRPEEARLILKEIEEELRRRRRELRPAILGDATLEEALQREFKPLRDAGIDAKLGSLDTAAICRSTQQLCFRIAREALSNVSRHARATAVEISICYQPASRSARLSIADNGTGIDLARMHDGLGLTGLRERLELVGGSLSIESKPTGTTIIAEIPELSQSPAAD